MVRLWRGWRGLVEQLKTSKNKRLAWLARLHETSLYMFYMLFYIS